MGQVGGAVLTGAGHERDGERHLGSFVVVEAHGQPMDVGPSHRGRGAVDQAAGGRAAAGVQQDPVPGPVLPLAGPTRPAQGRSPELPGLAQVGPGPVGQVLGVGDLAGVFTTVERLLANLVLDVEQHETLAELDEDDYVRRVGAMRADIEKGRRMAKTAEELDAETLALHESDRPTQEGSK